MLEGITLIILGALAAPSIIAKKKPEAKEWLDKLTPWQGWIGLIMCLYGVWGVISAIMNIGMLADFPIWWITWIAATGIQAILGFILGYGMISQKLLSKNEAAKEKGEALLAKLTPIQGKLGLFGIIIGLWVILAYFLFA